MMKRLPYTFNDGGRMAAGLPVGSGDCVARAIAIVSGLPYAKVYNDLAHGNATQRVTKRTPKKLAGKARADRGILTGRKWFTDYMTSLGFEWTPTMQIGSGCTVHLATGELPMGRLVVCVSKHYTAIIDGVIHDTHDPSRDGTRCVYGYWRQR